jgi:hypothetical protein
MATPVGVSLLDLSAAPEGLLCLDLLTAAIAIPSSPGTRGQGVPGRHQEVGHGWGVKVG